MWQRNEREVKQFASYTLYSVQRKQQVPRHSITACNTAKEFGQAMWGLPSYWAKHLQATFNL